MTFVDRVIEVHERLEEAGCPHAFGGALALAYAADPRGTVDIDVNVFLPITEIDRVVDALGALGLRPERDSAAWLPIAGIRLFDDEALFPVDVFPSLDDAYAATESRVIRRPFGPEDRVLPFLSAEDLVVFKLSFGRTKDWADLEAIAIGTPNLDVDYIERQLITLRGASMHPRVAQLRNLLAK